MTKCHSTNMKINTLTAAEGFQYSDAPQKSPEWIGIRAPRVGASELGALMGKGVKGQYLAPRKQLLREIAFSKRFNVPFSKFTNAAMQAGIDNEDFVAEQYAKQAKVELAKVGCFYNDEFVASPDRVIVGQNAGVEIKWLYDNAWSLVVENNEPEADHVLQMQGQMAATGWDYVDYVAANGNTGQFIVIRVERDEDKIAEILEEVKAVAEVLPMEVKNVYKFTTEPPTPVVDEGDTKWN